jgi:hypothetical protein
MSSYWFHSQEDHDVTLQICEKLKSLNTDMFYNLLALIITFALSI